jgi:MFS family permease
MKYSLVPDVSREVLIQLLLPTFFVHLTKGLLVATLPLLILENLNMSKMDVGFAVGAAGLGKIIGDIPAGWILGKVGAKNLMILSGIVIVVSSLLSLIAVSMSSYWFLIFATLVFGLGQGGGVISRMAIISDNIPKSERGRISALLGGASRLAMAIGPALGGILMSLSLSVLFLGQAVAGLCSVMIIFMGKNAGGIAGRDLDSPRSHSTGLGTLNRREFQTLVDISIFVIGIQFVRECRKLLIPLVGSEMGMPDDEIGWYTSVSYIIDALLFSVAGILTDTLGRNFTSCVSISTMIISQILCVPGQSPGILFFTSILGGVGNGLSSGIITAYGADLAPTRSAESKAEFLALYRLIGDIGEFVGPVLIGVVAQFNPISTMINAMCTVAVISGYWLLWRVPEPLNDEIVVRKPKIELATEFGIDSRETTISK